MEVTEAVLQDRCDWPEVARCHHSEDPEDEAEAGPGAAAAAEVEEPGQVAANISVPDTGKVVVCYFTNWAVYRQVYRQVYRCTGAVQAGPGQVPAPGC